uniref:Uncharacterized protein n=1 Tax=Rhizophora mucronata TaxID=61149 RepID=A0A2P2J3M0_RHIMU
MSQIFKVLTVCFLF